MGGGKERNKRMWEGQRGGKSKAGKKRHLIGSEGRRKGKGQCWIPSSSKFTGVQGTELDESRNACV